MPRINIVCSKCQSKNVMRDAWAVWDVESQEWILGNVFDQGFCDDCDGESRLDEVDLTAEEEAEIEEEAQTRRLHAE